MQKLFIVRVCQSSEEHSIITYEVPEIKTLLEEGWCVKSITPCAAGAGDEISSFVTTVAFIVLQK